MTKVVSPGSRKPAAQKRPDLDRGFYPITRIIIIGSIGAALLFVAVSIYYDADAAGARAETLLPYLLLCVATTEQR
jgi:inorganic phosphate transporter, PiT family